MKHIDSYWYVSEGPRDLSLKAMHDYLDHRYASAGIGLGSVIGTHLRSLWWVIRSSSNLMESRSGQPGRGHEGGKASLNLRRKPTVAPKKRNKRHKGHN